MRALMVMVLLMTSCGSWYKDGHRTLAVTLATTDTAWRHALGAMREPCVESARECGRRGIVETDCSPVVRCQQVIHTLQTSVDAVHHAATESYVALEAAKAKKGTVGRAAIAIDTLVRVAGKLWTDLREKKLWPTYLK